MFPHSLPPITLSLNQVASFVAEQPARWGTHGKIDDLASMISLTSLWLHGNKFEGSVPDSIADLVSLKDLDLNGNEFVGLIPSDL